MSNEHYDVIAGRALEMGFEADHCGEQEQAPRDGLFICLTNNAFAGRPSLMESGLRVMIMAARVGVPVVKLARAELLHLRRVAVACNGGLALPVSEDARRVFELVMGAEARPWRIGRRASLLAYALNRSVIIRDALPNFEMIGKLWELSADNKRSAVSAAMNQLRVEMVRHGQLPSTFRFWFEKRADARAVYEAAQMGNTNRHGHDEDEVMMLEGVPVKACYARMKPQERRERMQRMHEASEMKRLGINSITG